MLGMHRTRPFAKNRGRVLTPTITLRIMQCPSHSHRRSMHQCEWTCRHVTGAFARDRPASHPRSHVRGRVWYGEPSTCPVAAGGSSSPLAAHMSYIVDTLR
jgi:hypothetical protein